MNFHSLEEGSVKYGHEKGAEKLKFLCWSAGDKQNQFGTICRDVINFDAGKVVVDLVSSTNVNVL